MPTKELEVLGPSLRAILKLSGKSMADVARNTDTSYGTLGPIFAGHRGMSRDMADTIATELGVPTEAIAKVLPAGAVACGECRGSGLVAQTRRPRSA